MDPDQQLRNLRDFLLVYNRMTEICFQRCSSNFNYRNLTMDEERCVDNCAGKLIRSNHRLMGTYVQLMPRMVQRRMEEMESKAAENAKAAEAAASASVGSPATDTSAASAPPQTPGLSGTNSHGEAMMPAGLEIPNDSAVSKSTQVKLSAAAPLTPTFETEFNKSDDGQSYISGFRQANTVGAQIESASLTASKQTLSESAPVSTTPASRMSQPTEGLSGQVRTPDVSPPPGQ
ncbi:mitochondrial import inner membrane translocase subunit Tim10 B isoform X2 [Betta splendens]|nr:mitochondrial import inner membrane translocase subunit Tim10 B isoform X2 [Betta splendens]